MKTFADYGIRVNAHGSPIQRVICPQCSHTRSPKNQNEKCLTVWIEAGTWSCAHCGWGKNEHLKKGSFAESKQYEHPRYVPKPLPKERLDKVRKAEPHEFQWLLDRGISVEAIQRNKLRKHGNATAFPMMVPNVTTPVNFKYRTPDKRFWQEAEADKVMFGLNDIMECTACIIVEGEVDKLSFDTIGMTSCVSVPDGAPSPTAKQFDNKFDFLENCRQYFEHINSILLACDTDEPGQLLTRELAQRLGVERCKVVRFPTDCKDANDVLVKHGADVLMQCVAEAEPMPMQGVVKVNDFADKLLNLYEHGFGTAPRSGFNVTDEHFKVFPGMITVVTGVPGHGKTVFLMNYLIGLAQNGRLRFGIYCPENPLEIFAQQASEILIGKPFLPGYNNRMTKNEQEIAATFINEHFSFIHSDTEYPTIELIIERATFLVKRRGINALVIDPWNKIDHQIRRDETEHLYVGRIIRQIQLFARQNNVHVFIVAHPHKLKKQSDGNYDVPSLYSISGSANWFNMPENGWVVYRQKLKTGGEVTKLFVEKVKHKFIGSVGYVEFEFDSSCHRFSELHAPIKTKSSVF